MNCTNDIPSPASSDEACATGAVRVIGLKDSVYDARVAWIHQWIGHGPAMPFDHWNLRLISQVDEGFTTLVLHGEDSRRMGRILREWRELFPGKMIVAVLSQSTPAARADLLRSGCDFVFDLTTPGPVAGASLAAGYRRRPATGGETSFSTAALNVAARLTPTEQTILKTLHDHAGNTVSYARLLEQLGKSGTSEAVKCLQVQMQRLRRKIVAGALIENSKSEGYRARFGWSATA